MKLTYFTRQAGSNQVYIFASLNHQGKRLKFKTGLKVPEKQWSKDSKSLVGGGYAAAALTKLRFTFDEYVKINKEASIQQVHNHVTGKEEQIRIYEEAEKKRLKEEGELSLMAFLNDLPNLIGDTFNRDKGKMLSSNYAKGFNTLHEHLKQFAAVSEKELQYEEVNEKFADDFAAFLSQPRRIGEITRKGLSPNVINKDLKLLKTAIGKAVNYGYTSTLAFKNIKLKYLSVHKITITDNELQDLERLLLGTTKTKLKGRSQIDLGLVRDTFVLNCHIGMRHSEFEGIGKDSVINDGRVIRITEPKTQKVRQSPLHPRALDLLKKMDFELYDGSAQKYNQHLKTIAKSVSGLKKNELTMVKGEEVFIPRYKLVTSHTGRRTAATSFFKATDNIKKVMQFMGFESEKVAWGYINITDEEKALQLGESMGWYKAKTAS